MRARMPARSAASIWLRISASSGETITVGPAPPRAAARWPRSTPRTCPSRCAARTSARRRCATSAWIAVHWSSRRRACGPASAARAASACPRRSCSVVVTRPMVPRRSDSPGPAPAIPRAPHPRRHRTPVRARWRRFRAPIRPKTPPSRPEAVACWRPWMCRRSGPGSCSSSRDLAAAGVDRRRDRAACAGAGSWHASRPARTSTRPTRGCAAPEDRHLLRVAATVPRIASDAVVSHQSAAACCTGCPPGTSRSPACTPPGRAALPGCARGGCTSIRRHSSPTRSCRSTGWRSRPSRAPSSTGAAGGRVAVTAVARTVVDIARTVGFEEAVAVLDAALHRRLVTPAALTAALDRMAGWPGAPRARGRSSSPTRGPMNVGRVPQPGRDGPARRGAARAPVGGRRPGRPCARHRRFRAGPSTASPASSTASSGTAGCCGQARCARRRWLRRSGVRIRMRAVLEGVVRWVWAELVAFADVAQRLPR